MGKYPNFEADQVYENPWSCSIRRIVRVHLGYIGYFRGGDRTYTCKVTSFRRWCYRVEAERVA